MKDAGCDKNSVANGPLDALFSHNANVKGSLHRRQRPFSNYNVRKEGQVRGTSNDLQVIEGSPQRHAMTAASSDVISHCLSSKRIQKLRVLSASTYRDTLLKPVRETSTTQRSTNNQNRNT